MARGPKIVQRFGENYLYITVRTSDEVVFDWNIEVLDLQRDGTRKSLTEVIRTISFSPDEIRESLGEKFIDIATIESYSDGANDDSDNRTWFVCTKPGDPTMNDPDYRASRATDGRTPRFERCSRIRIHGTRYYG